MRNLLSIMLLVALAAPAAASAGRRMGCVCPRRVGIGAARVGNGAQVGDRGGFIDLRRPVADTEEVSGGYRKGLARGVAG